MNIIRAWIWLCLFCLALFSGSSLLAADKADKATIGGDFVLTDHRGEVFDLQQQRGKVVVLFFGYTHCPVICPDSLAKMAGVLKQLEAEADQLRVVFVTLDPERDTVGALSGYVPFFGEQLTGLTGSVEDIQAVAKQYHAQFKLNKQDETDQNYTLDHTADIYVLNRQGKVSSIIPFGMPVEHIQSVVKQQLAETDQTDESGQPATQTQTKTAQHASDSDGAIAFLDLQGKIQDLQQWQGKPLLINFWASWCPPCRQELPSLNRAASTMTADVRFLAINVGEKDTAVQAFLQDYPIDFPVWLDEPGASMEHWQIKGMPTTVLLDANGKTVLKIAGEREWDNSEMLEQIRTALE
ncbi:MAG: SCO family protein [Thiolinea sp.]